MTHPTSAGVPLHPEACHEDPAAVRWVIPAGLLGFVGSARTLPEALRALVDDGTLVDVRMEPAAVRTTLAGGRSWRSEGRRVRSALQQGLTDVGAWVPSAAARSQDVLTMAVREVLAGEVGDYIRSHGGWVELSGVDGDDVRLRIGGACGSCPALSGTLRGRIEGAVRARYPRLGALRVETRRSAARSAPR